MKQKIVITIARQYGSGGRTVGEMLANELGIHYYNNELVVLASEKSGISEELFRKADERIAKRATGLFGKVKSIYDGSLISPEDEDFVSDKNLFNYQADVIKEIADRESCVIIGRAADFVLKERENVVSVFVHAPMDFLMEQASKFQPFTGKELERYIEKTDLQKAAYYSYYTGQVWSDARNYDLCLNSGRLGFEKCVEEIKAYMKVRFGEDCLD